MMTLAGLTWAITKEQILGTRFLLYISTIYGHPPHPASETGQALLTALCGRAGAEEVLAQAPPGVGEGHPGFVVCGVCVRVFSSCEKPEAGRKRFRALACRQAVRSDAGLCPSGRS